MPQLLESSPTPTYLQDIQHHHVHEHDHTDVLHDERARVGPRLSGDQDDFGEEKTRRLPHRRWAHRRDAPDRRDGRQGRRLRANDQAAAGE